MYLDRATLRRLACDCVLTRIIKDGSVILDVVGRLGSSRWRFGGR